MGCGRYEEIGESRKDMDSQCNYLELAHHLDVDLIFTQLK